jgi:hypothetical protein
MHPRAQDLLKLRELPELAPPPGLWERVLEAHAARIAARRFRRRSLAAAAAIALAVGATLYVTTRSDAPLSPTVAGNALPQSEAAGGEAASYAPLVAESARLERLLAELPAPRPVMVGSTAGTIVGLEDRIAFVDAQLSYAAAQDLAPTYREALWGERVELMNALLYVRFAQTQAY